MGKSEEYVNALIDTLNNLKSVYECNYQNVNDLDLETQDLEHEIELSSFNACSGYKLAKEFQKIRKERRKLKDENDCLKPLYDYLITNAQYKNLLNDLFKIRGEIKRVSEKQVNRLYKPKIRNDLTIPTIKAI